MEITLCEISQNTIKNSEKELQQETYEKILNLMMKVYDFSLLLYILLNILGKNELKILNFNHDNIHTKKT